MNKKILYSTFLLLAATLFISSYAFAANDNSMLKDAANGVRNVVGGAENAVEDAARGVSNTSKNITENMQNTGNNIGNKIQNTGNAITTGVDNNNNKNEYTAQRTSATSTTNNATLLGMDSNTWIWLIMALSAIGIGILIYSYFNQTNSTHYEHSDD